MKAFSDLPVLENFQDVLDFSRHFTVPADWHVFLSDVKNSTSAVEAGRYKEVNVVGASSIMAVINAVGHDIAYTFGGDGATFIVPPEASARAEEALLGAQQLAKESFSLNLRVGKVPVSELYRRGHALRIARVRTSEQIIQSVISGDGTHAAEILVKAPGEKNPFHVSLAPGKAQEPANFAGLECRWEPVQSRKGTVVSLLVMSTAINESEGNRTYAEILEGIENIYGTPEKALPVSTTTLSLASNISAYSAETKVRTFSRNAVARTIYHWQAYLITRVADFAWSKLGVSYGEKYRREVVANSDFRKFDGVLRMVLDGTDEQRQQLETLLEKYYVSGRAVHGIHASQATLLTCLIFDRSKGDHLHFVDGDKGGYALAAVKLKDRLNRKSPEAVRAA